MSVECESCAKTYAFLSFSLAPDSDPTVRLLLYHITRICRYGRFSKSIRPDEVGACLVACPLPSPFWVIARVTTCALCRKFVDKIVKTNTCRTFFFHSLVCVACKTDTFHPLFT